jgi:hypothetical protein
MRIDGVLSETGRQFGGEIGQPGSRLRLGGVRNRADNAWRRNGFQSLASGLRPHPALSERLNRLGNTEPNRSWRQSLLADSP